MLSGTCGDDLDRQFPTGPVGPVRSEKVPTAQTLASQSSDVDTRWGELGEVSAVTDFEPQDATINDSATITLGAQRRKVFMR